MDPKAKAAILATFKKVVVDPEFLAYCKKSGIDVDPSWEKDQEAGLVKYRDTILNNIPLFQKFGI
jgi:hypothetical protein